MKSDIPSDGAQALVGETVHDSGRRGHPEWQPTRGHQQAGGGGLEGAEAAR